ncbi:hypothetical protein GQ44DRAFT_769772 [Phaeosphaeriaceae sp. PMI808]|nr:hypothetical protein GQ44DRAFT_769772 [Phaeosphaeriaceae sp. PMI808]
MANYLTTQRTNTTGIENPFDIISFNNDHTDLESPPGICCQESFLATDQLGPKNSSAEYWWGKFQQQQLNEEGIEYVFRHYDLDVLLVSAEGAAFRLGAVGRCPVGNVTVGHDEIGLPFGMSFVGKRYDEPTVLRTMSAYKAHFPARPVPSLLD